MAKRNNPELFSSLLYILLGVLLIVFRSQTLGWAMTVAGVFFIVFGILDVVAGNTMMGGFSLVVGIAILVLGWTATQIVLFVLGILIALRGIVDLVEAFKRRSSTAIDVLYPVLTVVVGCMLAFGNGLDVFIVVTGVLLTVDGVLGLVNSLRR